MSEVFFPKSGSFFHVNAARSLLHNVDLIYHEDELPPIDGKTNGFTKLALNYEKRHKLKNNIVGIFSTTGSFIFQDQLKSDEVSFTEFGQAEKYFVGGNLLIPKKDNYVFPGLYEGELNVSQYFRLG